MRADTLSAKPETTEREEIRGLSQVVGETALSSALPLLCAGLRSPSSETFKPRFLAAC